MPSTVRILLFGDDPLDNETIETVLRVEVPGLELTAVIGDQAFRDALRRLDPHVIVLDGGAPGIGRMAALRAAAEALPLTPVIVVTGSSEEQSAAETLEAGAAECLPKQRLERLGPAVRHALERRRMLEEREQALRALDECEERYALALRGANDGIWEWDFRRGQIYASARWRSILGDPGGERWGTPEEWLERVHADDRDAFERALEHQLQGTTPHLESECRMRHADGSYRWVLVRGVAVRDARGTVLRLAGSLTDISRAREAEARLLHDALHDPLTGLPNRTLFFDRLRHALRRTRRRLHRSFAVLYIDLDQFKVVNDSLGHLAGDELLVSLAARLAHCLRPGDTVARLGGDEFAALLDDLEESEDALRTAERIHTALLHPFLLDGYEIFLTASIGIVTEVTADVKPEDLLRDAGTAMFRAKRRGRGTSQIFDASMHAVAAARLRMETDLWRAVERGELRLRFQPVIRLDTDRLVGFEALVRWQHPERGLLPPMDFIPLAEEMGVIVPIGAWVMREACRQAAGWRRASSRWSPTVSVNVSAHQFAHGDVLSLACQALAEADLPARALRLELTESAVMEDPDQAAARLSRLKAIGVGLEIDDFGTGYSSLSHLQRFPIDALKIDHSFVIHMDEQEGDKQIVGAIVGLAGNLGLEAVAEGVMSRAQKALLKKLGCAYAQGYLFARPLEPERAARMFEDASLEADD